jgi:hypothetical protein
MICKESYYHSHKMEAIEIIEAFGLDFNLGNAIKYILRAGRKTENSKEDLQKAENYIHRAVTGEWLKGGENAKP